jgi:hypothetical protein
MWVSNVELFAHQVLLGLELYADVLLSLERSFDPSRK